MPGLVLVRLDHSAMPAPGNWPYVISQAACTTGHINRALCKGPVSIQAFACDALQAELTQTMQQFQQQLQQTALLAQQLLAQQVVSQAARGTSSSGTNSRAHSRPSSAAMRARHSATAHSSSGSRPGSKGQQRPPAASAAVPEGAARSTNDAAGAGSAHMQGLAGVGLTPQLMGLEGVLEVDEPPSAAEVQAYAVYLGMDPVEVSGKHMGRWRAGRSKCAARLAVAT